MRVTATSDVPVFHIRIDTDGMHGVWAELVKGSVAWCIGVEGDGEDKDIHCHMYLATKVSDSALRERIKKYGFVGNKSYSIAKSRDNLKNLAYVIKDGQFCQNHIDNDFLFDAIFRTMEVSQDMSSKKKASGYQAVEKYLNQEEIDFDADYSKVANVVAAKIIRYMSQTGLQVRRFHVISYTDTYLAKKMEHYNMFLACQIMFRH